MINEKSEQIYKEAVEYIPGGVNSLFSLIMHMEVRFMM